MADIATISTAIASVLAAAICPDGTTGSAVTGRPVIIRRGGLTQADLGGMVRTVQQGCDFIGIADVPDSWARLDEPLGRPWRMDTARAPTATIGATGATAVVTLTPGVAPCGTLGLRVTGLPGYGGAACVLHVATADDTADSIAAALAAPLPGAVATGGAITIPGAASVQALNAGVVTTRCIARRQEQMFIITTWSATPAARDALGQAASDALALNDWLTDADGSTFRIEARAASNDDTAMNRGLFSRPAHYLVTFDTDLTRPAPVMLAGGIGLPGGAIEGDVLLGPAAPA